MEGGKCLDINKFFLGNSIPNIITDALILCLPVLEVSKLQVRRSQKVAIGGMFLLGGLWVTLTHLTPHYAFRATNSAGKGSW